MTKKPIDIAGIMNNEEYKIHKSFEEKLKEIKTIKPDFDIEGFKTLVNEKYRNEDRKAQIAAGQNIEEILQANLTELEKQAEKIGFISSIFKDAHDKADRYLNKVDSTAIELEEFISKLQNTEGQVESFKGAIAEQLKLDAARKLWDERSRSANYAFCLSSIALGVLLIIIPILGLNESSKIISFFKSFNASILEGLTDDDKNHLWIVSAISRLVMISLPIMLYIWLIRIVVRYNMRSLLLKDDADQRTTMLETYLHLVEQDVATKADRPIILEALFRRAPGHGPESIEAPNLTDIMNLTKSKAGNADG